jgi:glycerophosphoryl diester phosphodiesterase
VWTVDDPAEANRLIDLGVNGIITNKPKFIRDSLGL